MQFLVSLIVLALTQACGYCGGCGCNGGYGGYGAGLGCGYGCMGCGCGYGSFGGLGYTGGMYGGWLSGSELSEDELDELCCSGYSFPSGCCYELCDDCCFSDELCGCAAPCGFAAPCGAAPCGFGAQGGCAPAFGGYNAAPSYACAAPRPIAVQPIAIQQPVCQAPTGYMRGSNMAGGQVCGHQDNRCAAAAGMGSRNCGYNQGNVCGSANRCNLDADACRRHGDRHFAKKCADEFLVRRCNEGVATGNDCYDSSRAHMCGSGARIAGNRACGNANANHCNAAGMRCASKGISGKAGCARMGAYGVASPSSCGAAMPATSYGSGCSTFAPATYSTGCGSPCMC